jgi:hypothetical protein
MVFKPASLSGCPTTSCPRSEVVARALSPFRQQDVTRAVKAVAAAGVGIARVEIDKSGKITIIAAPTEQGTGGRMPEERNEWDIIT